MVWVPSFVFLVAFVEQLIKISKTDKPTIPWNTFNVTRILITATLLALKLSETVEYLYQITNLNDNIIISKLIAPIIQISCLFCLLLIYYLQKRVGRHTSGSIWSYTLVLMICEAINYYSIIRFIIVDEIGNSLSNSLILDLIFYPVIILLFIFECYGDTPVIDPDPKDPRSTSPEIYASFFSNITFWWFNNFLIYGYKNVLQTNNLWKTLKRDKTSELVTPFLKAWTNGKTSKPKQTYQAVNGEQLGYNGVFPVIFSLMRGRFLLAAFLKLVQDLLGFSNPIILKMFLEFMDSSQPLWHGLFFASMFLIIPTIQSIVLGNYFYHIQLIGLHIRSLIMGAVYRKSLLLSGASREQSTSGEMVNLMAVDSQRFQDLIVYINLIWSAPLQIVLTIVLLYRELGWATFAGVAAMIVFLPLIAYLARLVKVAQLKLMTIKDERIKHMSELLSGIKVIKLYAWENSFIENLLNHRSKELGQISRIYHLDAIHVFLWNCTPFVVAVFTFAVYIAVDSSHILTPGKAFVSITLFNMLRFPITMLPQLVNSLVLTLVSSRRINKFLNNDELVRYVTRNPDENAISIKGAYLTWGSQSSNKDAVLKDINLDVKPGSFVAVIGQVASGKSSLLASILGELYPISGRFNICNSMSIAYVPQQAWIQNMTVKENILFGSKFNQELYELVVNSCSLSTDLETLPGGDEAEIGEKGINMSGGQKQRVSLARACYSNSDIYLLDDPLSALDSHVASSVFTEILSSKSGMLKNKTRILATNSLFVLPHVDHIVVLKEGQITESGSYQSLIGKENGQLSELMRQYWGQQKDSSKEDPLQATDKNEKLFNQSDVSNLVVGGENTKSAITKQESSKLIDVEKLELGSVNYRVYLSYFAALSYRWLFCMAILLVISAGLNIWTNLWLSFWSTDSKDTTKVGDTKLRTYRVTVYGLLGTLNCLAILLSSLGLARGAVRASKKMHSNLLDGVMHSPMIFFDTTPIGRIVNRFAKDIDVIDSTIPGSFRSVLTCVLQVVSTILLICYSFPVFLIIIVCLSVVYFIIQKIFIVTTRQLKRLESITRSPIYSNFSETLSGMSSIRAYDCVDRFIEYSDKLVDINNSCAYPNVIANRWLSVRLELFGNIITSSAAVFSVFSRGMIGAGIAGLTISYSLNITQTLSWMVRMTSDLETHIVSVERIIEYMNNKREDEWIKDRRPNREWPDHGVIDIKSYSTRYRLGTELVLMDVSLRINSGEKIGIVGRTGSGKSSLSLSLFRILEAASGVIKIDGENIADFGLHDLRSRLTIIPQDPVLFSGTLRFNLDPLKIHTDYEIWKALELAHLKTYILNLESGLDYKVSEYGENFSVGQRQLICLARAILRKSKILILDEATASVDLETDSVVQKTIREVFRDCTIITIAHRIHTILDSDRILLLDRGVIMELDTPQNLIANRQSKFYSLMRDAGLENT